MTHTREATAHVVVMGHYIESITITAEHAERIRRSLPERADHRGSWGRPFTFESEMVHAALGMWEPDSQYADPRAGSGYLAPVLAEGSVGAYINQNLDRVANESVVIPVVRDEDLVIRTVKTTIPVTAEQLAEIHATENTSGITSFLRNELNRIHGLKIWAANLSKSPARRKAKARATAGAVKTVYDVINPGQFNEQRLTTKDTIAEARAAAVELMEMDRYRHIVKLAIRGRVVRVTEDGDENSDLVVVGRPAPENATVTVDVDLYEPKPDAKIDHYVVAFDYHV